MARGPAFGVTLASLTAGLIIGLIIGWGLAPVEYTNADPADLRSTYKDDYLRMISAAYRMDGNLARARARLSQLGLGNPAQTLNTLVAREKQPGRDVLLVLAQALAAGTPTPRPAATPKQTASPRPTSGAITPEPTSALGITPTRTIPAFQLIERTQLTCSDNAETAYLRIFVRDAQGKDLPNVGIEVRWTNGDDTIYTGLKPERGTGFADFRVVPDNYTVTLMNALGDTASDLAVGEAPADCKADRGATPRGWKLVFQQSSTYP